MNVTKYYLLTEAIVFLDIREIYDTFFVDFDANYRCMIFTQVFAFNT